MNGRVGGWVGPVSRAKNKWAVPFHRESNSMQLPSTQPFPKGAMRVANVTTVI